MGGRGVEGEINPHARRSDGGLIDTAAQATAGIVDLPRSAAVVEYRSPECSRVVTTDIVVGAAREQDIESAKKVGGGRVVYDSLERLTQLQPARNGAPGISKTGGIRMSGQCPRRSDNRRRADPLIRPGRRGVGPIEVPAS